MIRAASRLKRGAVLNFKRTAALNSEPKCVPALNFKSKQNAPLNFTPERSPVLNFNRATLNFRSRCDEFYRVFLARGSYGAAILSDKILSSRGKNFKAYSKKSGVKFLKSAPKFEGEQKEGYDAKHR